MIDYEIVPSLALQGSIFIKMFQDSVYTGLGYTGVYRTRGQIMLVSITDTETSEIWRISTEYFHLTYKWKDHVHQIDSPSYQIDSIYGGYIRPNFGGISLSPETFDYWPPKRSYFIKVQLTDDTEETAETIYEGSIYLDSFTESAADFSLYAEQTEYYILEEITDYEGNSTALPKAFGYVGYVPAIRLEDIDGKPTYGKAGIAGSVARKIESVANNGSGKARFTLSTHGYSPGESKYIEGTVNYNGKHTITAMTGSTFDTDFDYVAENMSLTAQHVFSEGGWRVYDGARPISDNVIDNNDNTFSLTATPVDSVNISGTGQYETLINIFDYAKDIMAYTLNDFFATDVSVSFWQTSQQPLSEFLSKVASSFTHCFTIKDTQIVLYDMAKKGRTYSLSEFKFFAEDSGGVSYSYPSPVSMLRTSWKVNQLVEDDPQISRHIKSFEYEGTEVSEFSYGSEESVEILHSENTIIDIYIKKILALKNAMQVTLKITDEFVPKIGDEIIFTNSNHITPIVTVMYIRGIELNTSDAEIIVSGEGYIQ